MRTFKFRGKRIDNGEWIYGSLVVETYPDFCNYFIRTKGEEDWTSRYKDVPVDKNTLGQFTGLYDKNNKEIYEGDILKDEYGRIMKVVYKENWGKFQFELLKITGEKWTNNFRFADLTDWFDSSLSETPEIIGNIYDNPELLEGEQKNE